MKNKQLLSTISFLIISTLSIAQNDLTYGVKGGANFTGFHTGSSIYTSEFGVNIGGIAEYSFTNNFSIQTEILFNQKAGIFTDVISAYVVSKLNYIDIPILARIYVGNNFALEVGPQVGFNISEKTEFKNHEVESAVKILDTAVVLGFGYEFLQDIFLQGRYNYGLSKIFDNERYKNSVISLSLGYKFK